MAFKASKERKRKLRSGALGPLLIPNSGIEAKYRSAMRELFEKSAEIMKNEISEAINHPDVKDYFQDSAAGAFSRAMSRAKKSIELLMQSQVAGIVEKFAFDSDASSKSAAIRTAKSFSIEAPENPIDDLLQSHIEENVRLISGFSDQLYDKIGAAVTKSIQSGGQKAIFDALSEIAGMPAERAKAIAADQTSKVYTSLNTSRMKDAGLSKFEWVHSSAGKQPRHSHQDHDGKTFLLEGGPDVLLNEDGTDANAGLRVGDRGKPGYAPFCRCRMRMKLDS